jgi:hypothetical protein
MPCSASHSPKAASTPVTAGPFRSTVEIRQVVSRIKVAAFIVIIASGIDPVEILLIESQVFEGGASDD